MRLEARDLKALASYIKEDINTAEPNRMSLWSENELMFCEQLEYLRYKEKRLVKSIRDEIKGIDSDCNIIYLPNLIPKKRLEYILIAMEPSFGRWAKDENEAEIKIKQGFRNFILSWDDFIFHYCIINYLSPSYYVTDISKAAMKVRDANRWRNEIYPKWIKLLKEEIRVIGKNDCKLIFVGRSVRKFLEIEMSDFNVVKTVLHYSGQAGKQRKKMSDKYPEDYINFISIQNLSSQLIIDFAEKFLEENSIPSQMMKWILQRLKDNKSKLTESRKQLMFSYYQEFSEIRKAY